VADIDTLIDEFGLDAEQAIRHLLKRGYCLQDDLCWLKPEVYYIPTAKEMRAVDYLWQAHGYRLMYSVDIKKPIKRMCELRDSTLLKAHIKLERKVNERFNSRLRKRNSTGGRGRTQKGKMEKAKSRV